jgi:hypothetical protein
MSKVDFREEVVNVALAELLEQRGMLSVPETIRNQKYGEVVLCPAEQNRKRGHRKTETVHETVTTRAVKTGLRGVDG